MEPFVYRWPPRHRSSVLKTQVGRPEKTRQLALLLPLFIGVKKK